MDRMYHQHLEMDCTIANHIFAHYIVIRVRKNEYRYWHVDWWQWCDMDSGKTKMNIPRKSDDQEHCLEVREVGDAYWWWWLRVDVVSDGWWCLRGDGKHTLNIDVANNLQVVVAWIVSWYLCCSCGWLARNYCRLLSKWNREGSFW